MKSDATYYEVVVAGGGIVGSTLALILALKKIRVLVIDLATLVPILDDTPPDLRVSAISCVSVELLRRTGAWQRINNCFCVPYRRLETWEWPTSLVSFDASSLHLSELGFIIENRRLQQALWQRFSDCETLTLRCPASLRDMVYDGHCWQLTLDDGSVVVTQIVVGADGPNSWVRRQVGIAISGWEYRQSCLLLSVETEGESQGVIWQEFHPSGPRAFLPLYGRWASLVWYDSALRIQQLKKLSLRSLTKEVQKAFPARLGPFILHNAASFPLTRQHASDYIKPGLALIGDAVHTINPLAGQGANLGFRDTAALAEVLITARDRGESWETTAVLHRYQSCRRFDNLLMQAGMDVFYTAFSNNFLPMIVARNFGLMLAQHSGGIKHLVLRYALGI